MTKALKNLKLSLQEEFVNYGVKDYKKKIAQRVPCSYEAVRTWFTMEARVSESIKLEALKLLDEVKAEFREDLNAIKS